MKLFYVQCLFTRDLEEMHVWIPATKATVGDTLVLGSDTWTLTNVGSTENGQFISTDWKNNT